MATKPQDINKEAVTYAPKDFKNDSAVRWCPGCGDHGVLNAIHRAMANVGIPPYQVCMISGIGCYLVFLTIWIPMVFTRSTDEVLQ